MTGDPSTRLNLLTKHFSRTIEWCHFQQKSSQTICIDVKLFCCDCSFSLRFKSKTGLEVICSVIANALSKNKNQRKLWKNATALGNISGSKAKICQIQINSISFEPNHTFLVHLGKRKSVEEALREVSTNWSGQTFILWTNTIHLVVNV